MTRPFRFGLQASFSKTGAEIREQAKRAEAAGYNILTIADHLGFIDPFIGCATAAESSTTLRVGTQVVNVDFHPAALLARSAATIDLVSDGRFELGIGAGHMKSEYLEAALAFDRAGRRVQRMAETIEIVRSLFAGEEVSFDGDERSVQGHKLSPLPPQGASLPIFVGGNGDRVLEIGATKADTVGFTGFRYDPVNERPVLSHMSSVGLQNRVDHVASFGGDAERQLLIQRAVVDDDVAKAAAAIASDVPAFENDPAAVLDSPFILVGPVDAICDELVACRERFGVSYFTFFSTRSSPEIDQVVARLAGT